MTLQIGDPAPDFTLDATGGQRVSLSALRGKNIIVYFYPKDDTPGCTQQACDIRDNINALQNGDTQVIGISKDSVASHEKFKTKFSLNFPLGADVDGAVCQAYGAWGKKSMFGKAYDGIIRSTFLIDKEGVVQAIWRNVKVAEHLPEIFKAIADLDKKAASDGR